MYTIDALELREIIYDYADRLNAQKLTEINWYCITATNFSRYIQIAENNVWFTSSSSMSRLCERDVRFATIAGIFNRRCAD